MRTGNTAKLVSEEVIILASRLCRGRYVLREDIRLPLSDEFTREQREALARKKKKARHRSYPANMSVRANMSGRAKIMQGLWQ